MGRPINPNSEHWKAIREQVIKRDKVCFVCKTRHSLTAHHVKPRRNGGKTNLKNLIALCGNCHDHVEKHDMDYPEIIKYKKQRWLQSQEVERLPGDKIVVGKDRFGIFIIRDVKKGDSIEYNGLWPVLVRGKEPVRESDYSTPAHDVDRFRIFASDGSYKF